MIVTKVHGAQGREFLVVAETTQKAEEMVETWYLENTYWSKEDLQGEIQHSMRKCLDATVPGFVEL